MIEAVVVVGIVFAAGAYLVYRFKHQARGGACECACSMEPCGGLCDAQAGRRPPSQRDGKDSDEAQE